MTRNERIVGAIGLCVGFILGILIVLLPDRMSGIPLACFAVAYLWLVLPRRDERS